MTDLKPKIFIGSSKAGIAIAQKIKSHLSLIGDCFIWNEMIRQKLNVVFYVLLNKLLRGFTEIKR